MINFEKNTSLQSSSLFLKPEFVGFILQACDLSLTRTWGVLPNC